MEKLGKLEKAVAVSGICSVVPEENSGKWNFPESQNAPEQANLPGTLVGTAWDIVPTFHAGYFFEIDSYSLLEHLGISEKQGRKMRGENLLEEFAEKFSGNSRFTRPK